MNAKIQTPEDIISILDSRFADLIDEQLTIITTNTANKLIAIHNEVTKGTQNCVLMSSKQIARIAVNDYAAGVIIVHNHPSGDPKPSKADIENTEKLHKALEFLEINLVDHIIIGDTTYFSFANDKVYDKN